MALQTRRAGLIRERFKHRRDAQRAQQRPTSANRRLEPPHARPLGKTGVCLDEARAPLANDASARALRRTAPGRKHHPFVGAPAAGKSRNRPAKAVVTSSRLLAIVRVGGPTAHGKRSEVEARSVLEAWRRSGLTLQRFAKQRGFVPQRLRWWQAKFARPEESTALAPLPTLLPIRVITEPQRRGEPVTVLLRTGHVLQVAHGFDEQAFARVVALLEGG